MINHRFPKALTWGQASSPGGEDVKNMAVKHGGERQNRIGESVVCVCVLMCGPEWPAVCVEC